MAEVGCLLMTRSYDRFSRSFYRENGEKANVFEEGQSSGWANERSFCSLSALSELRGDGPICQVFCAANSRIALSYFIAAAPTLSPFIRPALLFVHRYN